MNKTIIDGDFFISLLNPETPAIYRVQYKYAGLPLFGCELWGMDERRGQWSFRAHWGTQNMQVSLQRLNQMKPVSEQEAREFAKQQLRQRDAAWRAQFDPERQPLEIV